MVSRSIPSSRTPKVTVRRIGRVSVSFDEPLAALVPAAGPSALPGRHQKAGSFMTAVDTVKSTNPFPNSREIGASVKVYR